MITVGQIVSVKEYTDCFGKLHPRIDGMTVQAIRRIAPESDLMQPYLRIAATKDTGDVGLFEAAERFFDTDSNTRE